MADNSARIAELEAILQSGVSSYTNDGTTVSHDLGEVRKELRRLRAEDDTVGNKRPQSFTVNLGGF
jgi:polyphosphate kinase